MVRRRLRILVTSTLYPPIAVGGYERECAIVVERLREEHEVLVLTGDGGRDQVAQGEVGVRRELALLTPDERGSLRAPWASIAAARAARRALDFRPDLVYAWNGSSIPQAALRVLADSGTPMAFRVCEHWFGRLFLNDQFLRELTAARRSPSRAAWSALCRVTNGAVPGLRLDPGRRFPAAVSWNSEAIRTMAGLPPMVDPVLERIGHSVPRAGGLYEAVVRAPAPAPEVLFVGRVTPYKGLDVAIEALALLRAEPRLGDVRLRVVGPEDATHGAELRDQARRLGVAGAVDWVGAVDPDGVAAALARAHVLLVPSVWQEPFPLVTIEGAFARVPIVASDVGGIREGMQDDEHALLYPAREPATAAAALARTLLEPDATAARVERAHERAQAFRLEPYLEDQAQFVSDAYAALRASAVSAATSAGA
jgi:glycosyltransferase involved in cell wall biosynthesis